MSPSCRTSRNDEEKRQKREMEAAAHRSRVLAEVDPRSEWVRGDEFDTLIIDVSGFTKDQLKVQVEPSGSLRISGERALNGSRQWSHFLKRFDLPDACDATAIKVQLDKGVLYVQVPRPNTSTTTADDDEDDTEEYLEDEAGVVWTGGHTAAWRNDNEHPVWRLVKALSQHRHVVLNVALAVVLLWLVAFGKSRPSGGQIKNE